MQSIPALGVTAFLVICDGQFSPARSLRFILALWGWLSDRFSLVKAFGLGVVVLGVGLVGEAYPKATFIHNAASVSLGSEPAFSCASHDCRLRGTLLPFAAEARFLLAVRRPLSGRAVSWLSLAL